MFLFVELLVVFLISYFSVKKITEHAHTLDLLDVPNERSHHCDIIPSGGGIAFIAVSLFAMLLFEFFTFLQYWFLFVGMLLVFAMGIYDDRHEVSAKLKFVAIFAAVFLMFFNDFSIDTLGVWYGYSINLVWWIALPFSMFAIAGFTNALNLIDGIDGLAGTISVVILLFFSFIGFSNNDSLMISISLFTVASTLGFLLINWYPAKIFMGDSGSLALGFTISILAVLSLEYIHPVAILYLTAIPLLDTLIVMTRRIIRKKSPFKPDKTHLHHILIKFFDNSAPKTVFFLVIMQIIFSGTGYAILDSMGKGDGRNIPLFGVFGFVLFFLAFYMISTGMHKRQLLLDKQEQ